jgi:hypothetical protein
MNKRIQDMDLATTGRQPSEEDFAQISAWIKLQKTKGRTTGKPKADASAKKHLAQQGVLR